MQRYIVFLNKDGKAIATLASVSSQEEAEAMMESPPLGTIYHDVATKEELLHSGYGLYEEDFDVEDVEEEG